MTTNNSKLVSLTTCSSALQAAHAAAYDAGDRELAADILRVATKVTERVGEVVKAMKEIL